MAASIGRGLAQAGLERVAAFLSPGFVSFAGDEDGLVEDELAPREWEWNLETVPALKTDLRLDVAGYGNDRQSSNLSKGDDTLLDDITRALWAIRRHGQVISPFCMASEFEQGLGTATAAGAAN